MYVRVLWRCVAFGLVNTRGRTHVLLVLLVLTAHLQVVNLDLALVIVIVVIIVVVMVCVISNMQQQHNQ